MAPVLVVLSRSVPARDGAAPSSPPHLWRDFREISQISRGKVMETSIFLGKTHEND
jgi:hypothetical protein